MKKLSNRKKITHKTQSGFSLLEVMIALVVSNVALLGLVAGELKSLQYAQNSYQYTVSLIYANNTVEHILNDVCELKNNNETFNDAYVAGLQPADGDYLLHFEGIVPAEAENVFTESFMVYMSWVDERMKDRDQNLNEVALMANFPTVTVGCDLDG